MTRSNLISRIHKGGGEGWFLPEDFDWSDNKPVNFIVTESMEVFYGETDARGFVQSDGYDGSGSDVWMANEIAVIREAPQRIYSSKVIEDIRTLSQLDRKGGGE